MTDDDKSDTDEEQDFETPEHRAKSPTESIKSIDFRFSEYYSEIVKEHNNRVPSKLAKDYDEWIRELLNQKYIKKEQRVYINDYIKTIQRMTTPSIDDSGTSTTGTIKMNELVVRPEIFNGVRPRPSVRIRVSILGAFTTLTFAVVTVIISESPSFFKAIPLR